MAGAPRTMAGLPGIGPAKKKETNDDLRITDNDHRQSQHVSSSMAAALLGMNKFTKLERAREQVHQEDEFSPKELDDFDSYHRLVVDGIGKENGLLFAFDLTRKANDDDFLGLINKYYNVLAEKLGLENSGQVANLLKQRAAIKSHLCG